jgi:acylphosphatase
MKRVIIIAKGKVQRVNYRDAVEDIARELNITGFVENLKPHDIRIVAEGEDERIDQFIERIKIKKFPIDVERIGVSFEEFKGEFEYFEIKRGEWGEEIAERLDTAGKLLYKTVELGERSVELSEKSVALGERSVELSEKSVALGKRSVELSEKSLQLSRDSVEIGKKTLEKLDNFHHDTIQRFDNLDERYGKIAENMERILEELKEERKEYRESIEKLIKAIIESRRNR